MLGSGCLIDASLSSSNDFEIGSKEVAIYVAYFLMKLHIENSNSKPQRKEIIAALAEYFGLTPRRVYKALKRQEPRGKMHDT